VLTQTTAYRRIVFSGNDAACIDTSVPRVVNVLPLLRQQTLDSDSNRYCAGDIPLAVVGSVPTGGSGEGSYSYSWESDEGSGWKTMAGFADSDYTPLSVFESGLSVRRIVYSGKYNACTDTSDGFLITVIPYIFNETGLNDQAICQNTSPVPLNATPATGGLNGITYEWISRDEGSEEWNTAEGNPSQAAYSAGVLINTRLYARKAYSDICTKVSDTVMVMVYPSITNNTTGSSEQYTCFNTSEQFPALCPRAGKPEITDIYGRKAMMVHFGSRQQGQIQDCHIRLPA
jgi:hypothetical protein